MLLKFSLLFALYALLVQSNSIKFDLPGQVRYRIQKKCLTMWMARDSHVTAQFNALQAASQTMHFEIYDNTENYNKYGSKAGFTESRIVFTPSESTDVSFCFWNSLDDGVEPGPSYFNQVSLDIQIGKTEEEYSKLAKAEKIKPQELELLRLEERFHQLMQTMEVFKFRDVGKSATHEITKKKIANFSFFSIGVLVVVGIWQIAYLRHYFKSKRLI
ncbi:hypothetical protein K502DRAFT_342892 [Neoconidiobolus thromboides FSU 785]|nr:hypothetical protein K502DRAFT_342892 [Neoconidiobolus thromboides FSU 785]